MSIRTRVPRLSHQRKACFRHETTSTQDPVTGDDIQNLKQELKTLQQLMREHQSQSYHVESLTRAVSEQSTRLEQRLETIETHVSKISGVEQLLTNLRDLMQNNPAFRVVMDNLETIVSRSTPFVRQYKYALLALLASIAIAWRYRASIFYQRTSEEVADLARRTLEQDSLKQSIQDTLHTVANNPSTLTTLNDLVQELITHERTQQELVNLVVHAVNTPEVQKALLELLEVVFKDPYLQQLTGEFLLRGLDIPDVKAMLDAQTADLVRETVRDDSVQKATAVGVQRALWYSITPPFLWRFLGSSQPKNNDFNERNEISSKEKGHEREAGISTTADVPSQ